MNNPKGVRNRNIQLKFYVNEKELKKIKKRMNLLLEKVEIFPEKQENGKIIKHIKHIKHIYFNFPVWYEDEEVFGIGWKSESRGEAFLYGEIFVKIR